MLLNPNGSAALVKEEPLTRDDMKVVTDFEQWCKRRGLQFWLRCKVCQELGLTDGVHGNNETNASQYVMACGHVRRVHHNPVGTVQ